MIRLLPALLAVALSSTLAAAEGRDTLSTYRLGSGDVISI